MKNLILLIIGSLILNSCATAPSQFMPKSFNSASNNGMIVGTIAIKNERPIFNNYFFHYLKEGEKKTSVSKMIKISPAQTFKLKFKPDFIEKDKAIYYFSITNTPGNYKFKTLRLHANGGFIQSQAWIPMMINFTIEKGKVKYLGEIFFDYNQSVLILNDKKERDIEKFKNQFPNLKID